MNVLLWCVTGFLMILGLAQLWELMVLRWYRPQVPLLRYEVIPVSGEVENAEQLAGYVRLSSSGTVVMLVDMGLDSASRELCRHFCQKEQELLFLSKEEAQEMIFAQNPAENVEKSEEA